MHLLMKTQIINPDQMTDMSLYDEKTHIYVTFPNEDFIFYMYMYEFVYEE